MDEYGRTYVDVLSHRGDLAALAGTLEPPPISWLDGAATARFDGDGLEAHVAIAADGATVTVLRDGGDAWTMTVGRDLEIVVAGGAESALDSRSFRAQEQSVERIDEERVRVARHRTGETRYRLHGLGLNLEHTLHQRPSEIEANLAELAADPNATYELAERLVLPADYALMVGGRLVPVGATVETSRDVDIVPVAGGPAADVLIGRPQVLSDEGEIEDAPVSYVVERESERQYRVSTRVPLSWLEDSARSYPLVIDPNVVIYTLLGEDGSWETTPLGAVLGYSREQWIMSNSDLLEMPAGSVIYGISLYAGLPVAETRTQTSIYFDNTGATSYASSDPPWEPLGTRVFYGEWGRTTAIDGYWGEVDNVEGEAVQNLSGTPLCTDDCSFPGDGDCDDGGPDSDFDLCDYGSDCTDCGVRPAADFFYTGGNLLITAQTEDGDSIGGPQEYYHVPCTVDDRCAAVEETDSLVAFSDAVADSDPGPYNSGGQTTMPGVRLLVNVPQELTIGTPFTDYSPSSPSGHPYRVNMYSFTLHGDATDVDITTTGTSGDTRMWLYDGNGTLLACSNADEPETCGTTTPCCTAGTGFASLNDLAPDAGTYFIKVDENDRDARVDYDILVWTNTPDAPALPSAYTDSLKETTIDPESWQSDDDPFFDWEPPNSPDAIVGYAVTFEGEPDCDIDTTRSQFQFSTAALPNGTWDFEIKTVTQAGYCSVDSSPAYRIYVDDFAETPQNLVIYDYDGTGLPISPSTWQQDSTVRLGWTPADLDAPPSGYISSIDGAASCLSTPDLTAEATQWDVPALEDGKHDLEIYMVDEADNCSAPAQVSVYVDTASETISGLAAYPEYSEPLPSPLPATWQSDDDPYFEWTPPTVDELTESPIFGYSVQFDVDPDCAVDVTDPIYTVNPDGLPNGAHTFRVRALDAAGNCGPVTPEGTLEIWVDDTAEPPANLRAFAGATSSDEIFQNTWQQDASIRLTWTDKSINAPASGFVVAVDADPNCPPGMGDVVIPADTTAWDVTDDGEPLAPDLHDLRVVTLDEAGNCSAPPAEFTVAVDPDDEFVDNVLAYTEKATATRVQICNADGSDSGSCTPASPTYWQSDNTPYFDWSAPASTSPISGYSIQFDGEPDCLADIGVSELEVPLGQALANGKHFFRVRPVDQAGNCPDTTSPEGTFEIRVDDTAEAPANLRAFTDGTESEEIFQNTWQQHASVHLTWADTSVNAPASGFVVAADDEPFSCPPGSEEVVLPAGTTAWDKTVDPGTHVLRIATLDEAGNCSLEPATFNLYVDTEQDTVDAGSLVAYPDDDEVSGTELDEGAWQQVTTPHFTWAVTTSATQAPITGYSIRFDAEPDCLVDVTEPRHTVTGGGLADGEHFFYVRVLDEAGHCGPVTPEGTFEIWVDSSAEPVEGLRAYADEGLTTPVPAATWQKNDTVWLSWSDASRDAAAVGYNVSTSGDPGCATPYSVDAPGTSWPALLASDGEYTLQVRTIDQADNCSEPAQVAIWVDTTSDPLGDIGIYTDNSEDTSILGDWQPDDDPYFSWAEPGSLSPIAGYSVQLNGDPDCVPDVLSPNFPVNPDASLANGIHTFAALAIDEAGNCGDVTEMGLIEFHVDDAAEPPVDLRAFADTGETIAIDEGEWQSHNTVRLRWTDDSLNAEAVDYSWAVDAATCVSSASLTGGATYFDSPELADGTRVLRVSTVDEAGNCSPPAEFVLLVDTADETETVHSLLAWEYDGGPPIGTDYVSDNDPFFTWDPPTTPVSPIAGYSVAVDAEPDCVVDTVLTEYQTPPDSLADGIHHFNVAAVDEAGNCASVPIPLGVWIDATAESVTGLGAFEAEGAIDPIPAKTWQTVAAPYFDWDVPSSESAVAGFTVAWNDDPDCPDDASWDGVDVSVADHAIAAAGPGQGQHVFRVRAVDEAGNCGPPASFEIWIDTGGDPVGGIRAYVDDTVGAAQICNADGSDCEPDPDTFWQPDNDPYFDWDDVVGTGAPIVGYATRFGAEPDCATTVIASEQRIATDGLEDGVHTFYVRARDSAGNCSAESVSFELWVDARPDPIDTIEARTAAGLDPIDPRSWQPDDDPYFSWTATSSTGTALAYSWALDTDPDCTPEAPGVGLPDNAVQLADGDLTNGPHSFNVRAIDIVDNCGPTESFEIWVDDAAEVPTGVGALTARGGASILNATWQPDTDPFMTWTHSSVFAPAVGFSVAFDGEPDCVGVDTTEPNYDVADVGPALGPGMHTFKVSAIDSAGNCSVPSAAFEIWIDPDKDMIATLDVLDEREGSPIPVGAWQQDSDPFFEWSVDAAGLISDIAGYAVAWNVVPGCTITQTAAEFETPAGFLPPGQHNFTVRAIDEAGNCGDPKSLAIWVDQVADIIALLQARDDVAGALLPPDTWIVDDDPYFEWETGTPDAPLHYRYALDATADCLPYEDLDGTTALATTEDALVNGEHTFEVRTVDDADNCGPVARIRLLVDDAAETIDAFAVTAGPGGPTVTEGGWANAPPVLNWDVPESVSPVVGYAVGIDASVPDPCSVDLTAPPLDLAGRGLSPGAHTVDVRVVDMAGNCGSATTFGFSLDETPEAAPAVTMWDQSGDGRVELPTDPDWQPDNDPYWTWTAPSSTAGIVGYSVRIDGGPDCSPDTTDLFHAVTEDAIAEGRHVFGVRAVDAAGNCGAEALVPFRVDSVPDRVASLLARTAPEGTNINQRLWQADDDPYFLWEHNPSTSPIDGYATGFDAELTELDCSTTQADPFLAVPEAGLTDGQHRFGVRVHDEAGNCGPLAEFEIWVLTSLPEITLETVAPSPARAGVDVNVTFTVNRRTTNPPAVLVGAGAASQASAVEIEGGWRYVYVYRTSGAEAEGERTVTITVIDDAGNLSTVEGSVVFDFTPAELDVTVDREVATTSDHLTITIAVDEGTDEVPTVTVDGINAGTPTPDGSGGYTLDYTVTGAESEGPVIVRVSASDEAGNVGEDTALVTLDFTAPEVTWTFPSRREVLNLGETVELAWETEDANSDLVDILFSTDGGLHYDVVVADDLADEGHFEWTVDAAETTVGRLRLIATDRVGLDTTEDALYDLRVREPVADHLIVSADQSRAVVGDSVPLTIILVDQLGDRIEAARDVSVEVTGSATFSDTSIEGAELDGTLLEGALGEDGRATAAVLDRVVEVVEVSAHSDGLPEDRPSVSATIRFETSGPDHLVAYAEDGIAPTGGIEEIEVHVIDREGNVVPAAVPIQVETEGAAVFLDADLADVTGVSTGAVEGTTASDGTGRLWLRDLTAETVTVTPSADASQLPAEVPHEATAVTFVDEGRVDPFDSRIVADPTVVLANGVATSLITVEPLTSAGTPVEGEVEVAVDATYGSLSAVVDAGDGAYTSRLSGIECPDDPAVVTATVDGVLLEASAEVSFTCADLRDAEIEVAPDRIPGDGTTCATVTVTPLLEDGTTLGAGHAVQLSASFGELDEVIDLGDGSYTANFCSSECHNTTPAIIEVTVDGMRLASLSPGLVGQVTVFCIGVDPFLTEVLADPLVVPANGLSTSTVTVTPYDTTGATMGSGLTVGLDTDLGQLTPPSVAEDNGDGTYVARLASATPGVATVSAAVNGVSINGAAQISFFEGRQPIGSDALDVGHRLAQGVPTAGAQLVLAATITSLSGSDLDEVDLLVAQPDAAALIEGSVRVDGAETTVRAQQGGWLVPIGTVPSGAGTTAAAIEVTYEAEILPQAGQTATFLVQAFREGERVSPAAPLVLTLGTGPVEPERQTVDAGCCATARGTSPSPAGLLSLLAIGALVAWRRRRCTRRAG